MADVFQIARLVPNWGNSWVALSEFLFQDVNGTVPVTSTGQTVLRWNSVKNPDVYALSRGSGWTWVDVGRPAVSPVNVAAGWEIFGVGLDSGDRLHVATLQSGLSGGRWAVGPHAFVSNTTAFIGLAENGSSSAVLPTGTTLISGVSGYTVNNVELSSPDRNALFDNADGEPLLIEGVSPNTQFSEGGVIGFGGQLNAASSYASPYTPNFAGVITAWHLTRSAERASPDSGNMTRFSPSMTADIFSWLRAANGEGGLTQVGTLAGLVGDFTLGSPPFVDLRELFTDDNVRFRAISGGNISEDGTGFTPNAESTGSFVMEIEAANTLGVTTRASGTVTVSANSLPAAMNVSDWTVAPRVGFDRQLLLNISTAPSSSETITGYEVRIGGSGVSTVVGQENLGERSVDVNTDSEVSVEVRAVSSLGAGPWSDIKTATPGQGVNALSSKPLVAVGAMSSSGDWADATGATITTSGGGSGSVRSQTNLTVGTTYRVRAQIEGLTGTLGQNAGMNVATANVLNSGFMKQPDGTTNVYTDFRVGPGGAFLVGTVINVDVEVLPRSSPSEGTNYAGVVQFPTQGGAGTFVVRNFRIVEKPAVLLPSGGEVEPPVEPPVTLDYSTRNPMTKPFASDSVWYIPIASDAKLLPIGGLWPHGQDVLGDGIQNSLLSDTLEDRKRKNPITNNAEAGWFNPDGTPEPAGRYLVDEEPVVPWRLNGHSVLSNSYSEETWALYGAGKYWSGSGPTIAGYSDFYNVLLDSGNGNGNDTSKSGHPGTVIYGDYRASQSQVPNFVEDVSDDWQLYALARSGSNFRHVSTGAALNSSGAWYGRTDASGNPTDNVHVGVNAVIFQGQPMERRNSRNDYQINATSLFPNGWVDAAGRKVCVASTRVPSATNGNISVYAGRNKSYIVEQNGGDFTDAGVQDESRFGSHGGSNTSAAIGITAEMVRKIYSNDPDAYDAIDHCLKTGIPPMMSYNPALAGGIADGTGQYLRPNSYTHPWESFSGSSLTAIQNDSNGGAVNSDAYQWPASRSDNNWNNNSVQSFYSGGNPHIVRGARYCLPKTIQGKTVVMEYDPAQALVNREVSTGSTITWYFETKLGCAFARASQKYGIAIDDGNGRTAGVAPFNDPEVGRQVKPSAKQFIWRFEKRFIPETFTIKNAQGVDVTTGEVGSARDTASHFLQFVDGVERKNFAGATINPAFPRVVWLDSEQPNPWSRDNAWISGHLCVVMGTSFTNPGGGTTGSSEAPTLPAFSYIGGNFQVNGEAASVAEKAALEVWRATNTTGNGTWVPIVVDVFGNTFTNRATTADATAGKFVFGDLDEGNYQFRTTADEGGTVTSSVYSVVWDTAQPDLTINMT